MQRMQSCQSSLSRLRFASPARSPSRASYPFDRNCDIAKSVVFRQHLLQLSLFEPPLFGWKLRGRSPTHGAEKCIISSSPVGAPQAQQNTLETPPRQRTARSMNNAVQRAGHVVTTDGPKRGPWPGGLEANSQLSQTVRSRSTSRSRSKNFSRPAHCQGRRVHYGR